MRSFPSLPRPFLLLLAILFAAATVLYSALWMYYIGSEASAFLGIEFEHSQTARALQITGVRPGSGAERAGLQVGDRIVAINGRELGTLEPLRDFVSRAQPGDIVELTVERPGTDLLQLEAVLGPPSEPEEELPVAQRVAVSLTESYPLLFLVVGLLVLFLRLEDRNAWLLALLFASFIASAPLLEIEGQIHPELRGFALAYKIIFQGISPALFYSFFAVFPVASPLDRRLPWLKTVVLAVAVGVTVPLALWAWRAGSSRPLLGFADRVAESVNLNVLFQSYFFILFGLGLVSLVWNGLRAPTIEARRRIRVVVWGTVVSVTPALLLFAAATYARKQPYEFPFWAWAPVVVVLSLLPLSFAYAVVKHRVLEIPVLLKRSARYLLVQRGFTLLLVLVSAVITVFVARGTSDYFQSGVGGTAPSGVAVGVGLGVLLLWTGTLIRQRVTERLDRAFFRSAYDARLILQDLAERTRTVTDRQALAELLELHLEQALHPRSLVVYLDAGDGRLRAERGQVSPELQTLSPSLPVLAEVARHEQPYEVPPPESPEADRFSPLAPLHPECLVPVLGRDARLSGLLVLGPRLSEEPYSGEDLQLLASTASQIGMAVETIALAEKMAERLQAEQRAVRELEIAKQVQSNLFPRKHPPIDTLEYVGACIQARAVGGDYYDFLDLGPNELGLVLGDLVGKGISAALLMSNLQANLRSQYALAREDLPRLLQSVNRLFCESTAPHHFATLVFGHYQGNTRRLRYANCGHNPPVRLRADGGIERLESTAPVLGILETWETPVREVELSPGDTLVFYTDGITEAMSDDGEEFGPDRLLDTLRGHRHLPVPEFLNAIVATVQQFSGREQEDDLTLVVARVR